MRRAYSARRLRFCAAAVVAVVCVVAACWKTYITYYGLPYMPNAAEALVAVQGVESTISFAPDLGTDLGAFYPTVGRKRSSRMALRRFRAAYPNAYVFVQDGSRSGVGCALAEEFGAECERVAAHGWYGGTVFSDIDALFTWMRGLRRVASRANVTHVTLLEDDVWWLGPLPRPLGPEDNIGFRCVPGDAHLLRTVQRVCGARSFALVATGGDVMRAQMLMDPALESQEARALVLELNHDNTDWRATATDAALSAIMSCYGAAPATCAASPAFGNVMPYLWKGNLSSDVRVVHGMKMFYP